MIDSFSYIVISGLAASITIAARIRYDLPGSRAAVFEVEPTADNHPRIIRQVDAFPRRLHRGLLEDTPKAPQCHRSYKLAECLPSGLSASGGGRSEASGSHVCEYHYKRVELTSMLLQRELSRHPSSLSTTTSTATKQHTAKVFNTDSVQILCNTQIARVLVDEFKRAIDVEL
jgi:hypothetical protein